MRNLLLLAAVVAGTTGCIPWPMRLYIPDAASGKLEYANCTYNHDLPSGVRVERDGVAAFVSMHAMDGGGYVETRLVVPVGHVLALKSERVRIDPLDGSPPFDAVIPKVSTVDTPFINDHAPQNAHLMLPVDAPLPGRARAGFTLNYWTAARFAGAQPDAASVTLPPVTIDGVPAQFPSVRFDRRFHPVVLVFNC